mgnify:FL=1|jgi:hypothetical protein
MRFRCSAAEVPKGIRAGADGLLKRGGMFGLSERAARVLEERAAEKQAGLETSSSSSLPSSSFEFPLQRVDPDDGSARGSAGLAWAYSDGRPAGGTEEKGAGASGDGSGGGRLASRLRRSGGSVETEK